MKYAQPTCGVITNQPAYVRGARSGTECGQPAVAALIQLVPYDSRGDCETCGYDSEHTALLLCAVHRDETRIAGPTDDQILVVLPTNLKES